jgi:predicted nucleic acid-binding protein
MYLVGSAHPNRDRLERFLRANADEIFLTSAEVYQEIIHRYLAIDRRQAIADCFALLDALVATVYPVTRPDVIRAWEITIAQRRLSGRDCLHLAVMERHGLKRVLSCDEGFDAWPGIVRLP